MSGYVCVGLWQKKQAALQKIVSVKWEHIWTVWMAHSKMDGNCLAATGIPMKKIAAIGYCRRSTKDMQENSLEIQE
jgi:hypothetical protein